MVVGGDGCCWPCWRFGGGNFGRFSLLVGVLGRSGGGLGEVLGGLGVVLGRSWGGLAQSWAVIGRRGRFWERKGCPKGGILGGQAEPKSIKNRGPNLRARKMHLGSGFGRYRVVFWGGRCIIFVVFP